MKKNNVYICFCVSVLLISGCSTDSSVLKNTGSNAQFTKVADVNFKIVRNQLLPKAISSIISTQDEGGENAVIKQLQTCYEAQLREGLGLTPKLEACIAQDIFYTNFAAGLTTGIAREYNIQQSEIESVMLSKYVTFESMEKRVYDAMKSVGLQEPELSAELKEIKKIVKESSPPAFDALHPELANKQSDSNVLISTTLKERTATVLDFRNEIAYLPNENEPFTGKYEEFYPNGKKKSESNLKDGKLNGLTTIWNENGQKQEEKNWKNGILNGLATTWNEKRQKAIEMNFKNGKINGLASTWYENGQKQGEGNYKDGKKNGLITIWFENGKKQSEINYKDDKENGLASTWNENGQKKAEVNYIDGKQNGLTAAWNESGQRLIDDNESKQKTSEPMQEIISRCQTQMGKYGAAMVKACVDQDIEAVQALGSYMEKHKAIIGRCFNQMKDYGYAMVKACADQDIEAEDALGKY